MKDLAALGKADRAAHTEADTTRLRLREAVVNAILSNGMSESEAARQSGVSRQTIRAWLGKH